MGTMVEEAGVIKAMKGNSARKRVDNRVVRSGEIVADAAVRPDDVKA